MNGNPYFDANGSPRLIKSIVAFIDIIGFKNLIEEANRNGTLANEMMRLRQAFDYSFGHMQDIPSPRPSVVEHDKRAWEVKAFTDNIAIGFPLVRYDDAEAEFCEIMTRLSFFQFDMLRKGYAIRGAISVGETYVDNELFFGHALIEAYNAESTEACYPRITLAKSAMDHLRQYRSDYSDILAEDSDGYIFINYLQRTILTAEREHGPFYEDLNFHKDFIVAKLLEFCGTPAWKKYAWIEKYHNSFCARHSRYFNDSHRVTSPSLPHIPKAHLP